MEDQAAIQAEEDEFQAALRMSREERAAVGLVGSASSEDYAMQEALRISKQEQAPEQAPEQEHVRPARSALEKTV